MRSEYPGRNFAMRRVLRSPSRFAASYRADLANPLLLWALIDDRWPLASEFEQREAGFTNDGLPLRDLTIDALRKRAGAPGLHVLA